MSGGRSKTIELTEPIGAIKEDRAARGGHMVVDIKDEGLMFRRPPPAPTPRGREVNEGT